MSIGLIVEVLDNAPDTLTSGERLVLVVIAEWANDRTRVAQQSHNWTIDTICHRAGIKRSGLKSVLQGLARKGMEVRVPVRRKDGKSVYAYEGTAVTFHVPPMPERGGHSIPTQTPRGDATASERGGHSISEGMPQPPPSPQGSPLKKNPSSLSPREASIPEQPDDTDRERDDSASQRSKSHRLLLDAGCPEDLLDETEEELRRRFEIRSPQWFRTAHGNGDLPELVVDVLDALGGTSPSTPSRAAFIDTLTGEPECDHGVEGGSIAWNHDGWMKCSYCRRQSGWTDVNNQGRTDNKEPHRKRSVSVLRAEQGLAVAAQLDREYGHEIRSPADRRVADAIPLYEKYRALEESP